jgi:hypothetical protein
VPAKYRAAVDQALKAAGRNARELKAALQLTPSNEREGMAFLIAHMPRRDLQRLGSRYLLENVRLAYAARREAPWGLAIPEEIFLNCVLPYAQLNERRDPWRQDFYTRFFKEARAKGSIERAALFLNQEVFARCQVAYHATKRPKPCQSPLESERAHYASCTGLAIMLSDALRSVGIPARVTGIPQWPGGTGNHTWVEVWDGGWHYLGANESTAYDQAWFSASAAAISPDAPSRNRIYAASFRATGLTFPLAWSPDDHTVWAEDVTLRYQAAGEKK